MSTEWQEDSPATQGDHTTRFVAEQGLPTWTRSYYDLGESAGTVETRAGILQLIADAERLRPAVVLFYKLDRAFRNSGEQSVTLRRLKKAGVRVLKVKDPNIEGPQGTMVDGLLGVVNQFERELVGMRIRDHNLTLARQGYWTGGRAPYGYQYRRAVREQQGKRSVTKQRGSLEPHPDEWAVALQFWQWALAGHRKTELAIMANEAGHRRRGGGLWTATEITRILASRLYAGFVPYSTEPRSAPRNSRTWQNTEWFSGQHQPMVTMQEWLQVQALLHAPSGTHRRTTKSPRAELAGFVRCKQCGGPVSSIGRAPVDGYYYGCQASSRGGSGHSYWTRSPWVVHMALQAILDTVAASLPAHDAPADDTTQRDAIERDLERLKTRRRRLRDLYRMGEYDDDMETYQRDARALDMQIEAREFALQQAGPAPDTLTALWDTLRNWAVVYETADTVVKRQRFWATFVERIRMDRDSLEVTLHELGAEIPRVWSIQLPPVRTKRPGSICGRGVTGERGKGESRSWFMRNGLAPEPVTTG